MGLVPMAMSDDDDSDEDENNADEEEASLDAFLSGLSREILVSPRLRQTTCMLEDQDRRNGVPERRKGVLLRRPLPLRMTKQ